MPTKRPDPRTGKISDEVQDRIEICRAILVDRWARGNTSAYALASEWRERAGIAVSAQAISKYFQSARRQISAEIQQAHRAAVSSLGPLTPDEEAEVEAILAEPIEAGPERRVSTTLQRYRRKPEAKAPVIAR